ncbi:PKD2 [Symbiodinium pilosum]|uniref:PKD2 protein n=1 Tax=Symbiodinium pilosum TaxID=2952 RepID=A0A812REI7_SYMPI|nr:PKD2 [Symbiodinium pilosum]
MPWKPSSCREPGLAHKYGLSCAAQNSHHFLETTAHQLLQNTFQEDPNRTVWLANLGPDGHFTPRNLSNFSASAWLMPDTLRARLTFMVYSPDVDILLLTNVEFIFPRTGHIWKDITHRALPLRIFATWSSLTFEVLFYALIASLLFTELWEIYSVVRKVRKNRSGWQSFFNSYFNVWNGVDWSCIVLAYVMLGFQIHKAVLTRELRESLEGYPGVVQSCYQESQPELCADRAGEELLQRAEAVGILARNCRLLRGIYPAIVILRTLKAFSAQPRLAILTRTLSAAAVDLFHFSLVFFCVFAAFAVMGTAFFGEDEVHFATLDRAASVLFFALMGEVQWTSIDSLGRPVKLLFVGAFQFVGLLLMLNMLIAIMMDIYACTKSCATRSEPLWTSLKEVTVRNWEVFMGREISLRRLLKTYERQKGPGIYQSEEVIQVQDFMKWLPDLKWSQAERIIVHALVNYKREKDEPVGLEELLQAITDIQADVVALSERLPDPEQPSDAKTGCRMESAHSLACRLQRRLNRGMTLEDPCRDGLMEALQRGASVFSGHLESLGMPNQERQLDSPLPLPTLLASSGRENRWLHEGSNQAGSSAGDLKISSGDVQV